MAKLASFGDGPNERHDYFAFGLRITSQLRLPELAALPGTPDASCDLTIRSASLPASLPGTDAPSGRLQVVGDQALLTVDKVARFGIRGGREIAVDPFPDASERNVRLFLLGSAFGVLCHQRGLMPLHANAIVVNGQAIAFAGRTGIGKSTLAAHFQAEGYDVLCDDVCVISFDDSGRPLAWPGLPRLKLWRDSAETFGHDSDKLERAVDGFDKFHVPLAATAAAGPYPLARVYILGDPADGGETSIDRLTALEAVRSIVTNTYRKIYLRPMGLTRANLLQAAALVQRADVFSARRRRGFDLLAGEAARLECHFTGIDTDDRIGNCIAQSAGLLGA